MKYLKMSLDYTNSKFFYLLLVAVVPSALIAFLVTPSAAVNFVCNYPQMDVSSFSAVYFRLTSFNRMYPWWLGVSGVIIIPFAVSVLFGAIDRHMRVGEFTLDLKRVRGRVNFNFMTALKFVLLSMLIYQILLFLNTVMFYAMSRFFTENVAWVLNALWLIIFTAIGVFAFAFILLWPPTMLHTGLSSAKAFSLSVRQGAHYNLSVAACIAIPLFPALVFMTANAVFHLRIGRVIDAIILSVLLVYYVVLMYTVFYDINGLEREDIKQTNIWEKSRKQG